MSGGEDYDSDAPEEFTQDQALKQDEELRNLEKENKARVTREGKERRKQWAERKTLQSSTKAEKAEKAQEVEEPEGDEDSSRNNGMLPKNIVELLAARENLNRKVFSSDSEDENDKLKSKPRKKKQKSTGSEPILLNEIPPPECLNASLEFLKKRKMQVARSSSVLTNSNQALRLISGMLTKN